VRPGRVLVLRFRLRKRLLLRYAVTQLAPVCRPVVAYRRRGHPGTNMVRLGPRVGGALLPTGTYRIVGRADAKVVLSRRFVVTRRTLAPRAISAEAARSVCRPAAAPLGAATPATFRGHAVAIASTPPRAAVAPGVLRRHPRAFTPKVLGDVFTKHLPQSPQWLRFLLVGFLGVAAVLLTAAALPYEALPESRTTAFVAERRLEVALLGVGIVAAVALSALLT